MTLSDLGLGTSHQTHIGLYEGVFTFLADSDVVQSAILVYDEYCDILDCSFDRIQNPDGTFRSPKIRVGKDPNNSVVSKIREIAKKFPFDTWYLVWFASLHGNLVFWLVKKGSEDYKQLSVLFPTVDKVYDAHDLFFESKMKILTNKINKVSIKLQKDIVNASQLGDLNHHFRKVDLDRFAARFQEVGHLGEEYVNTYLASERQNGRISSYVWENQSKESGLPYDFVINNINKQYFIDVKTTTFDFNSHAFFSIQELNFASQKDKFYGVYRVFNLNNEKALMRKCAQRTHDVSNIVNELKEFNKTMSKEGAIVQTMKLGLLPERYFEVLSNDIQLS